MKKIICLASFLCGALSISAQEYQALFDRSVRLIEADSLAKAEVVIKQALKLDPKNSANTLLFSNLGLVQRRLERYDEAIESYSFALNAAPKSVPLLLERAGLYLQQGENNRALVDYNLALDVNPELSEALLMRAYILMSKQDFPAARIDYERLLSLAPENYNGRLGLATLSLREGKHREALEIMNKLLVEYPGDATLYMARAGVEQEMDLLDLALIDLDKAIWLDEAAGDAYVMRGDIYLGQKKKSLAKLDFNKALSLGIPPADLRERLKACK